MIVEIHLIAHRGSALALIGEAVVDVGPRRGDDKRPDAGWDVPRPRELGDLKCAVALHTVGAPELLGRPNCVVGDARLVWGLQLIADEIGAVGEARLPVVDSAAQKPAVAAAKAGNRGVDPGEQDHGRAGGALGAADDCGRRVARIDEVISRPGGAGHVGVAAWRRRAARVAGVRHRAGHRRLAARVDVPGYPQAGDGQRDHSAGHDVARHGQRARAAEGDRAAAGAAAACLVERRHGRGVEKVVDPSRGRAVQGGAGPVREDLGELQLERSRGDDPELASLCAEGRHDLRERGPISKRARHGQGARSRWGVGRGAGGRPVKAQVGREDRRGRLLGRGVAAGLLEVVAGGQSGGIDGRLEVTA